jgi:hypothetical protein
MRTTTWLVTLAMAGGILPNVWACADLEPISGQPPATSGDGGAPDDTDGSALDGPGRDEAGNPEASQSNDAWTTDCLDLPNHELYETACAQTIACADGKLDPAWGGPNGASYAWSPDIANRVEGTQSLRIDCSNAAYCGVTYQCPEPVDGTTNTVDLSGWTHMHVSLQGNAPDVEIKMSSPPGIDSDDWKDEALVTASGYGYAADGTWHHLTIPLEDFKQLTANQPHHPFDLSKVFKPLIVGLVRMETGIEYRLQVDAVHFTK